MTERKGQQVGYLRVSSVDQSALRQLEGVTLDKSFTDHASGKDTKRPQLEACLNYIREGDTLVVHAMDRLARNLDDLRRLVLTLTDRGVHVRFVKENLTFTGEDSPMSHLLLNVMGAVAQFERDLIRERQREGIALAKAKGNVFKGRERALKPEQMGELRRLSAEGSGATEIARLLHVSRWTVYRYLQEMRAEA